MTAKHRKGRGNHKQEENSFKLEAPERGAPPASTSAPFLVLLLVALLGGATFAWFCFQQHHTVAYLADNFAGVQMKMVKLQALQEEVRMTNEKLFSSDGIESRIQVLEEAFAQVPPKGGAVVPSDLSAQVLSLQAEVRRLAELRHALDPEQLEEHRRAVAVELEEMKSDLVALKAWQPQLAEGTGGLPGGLARSASGSEVQDTGAEELTSLLEVQTVEVMNLKRLLARHKAQLDAATRDIGELRELLEQELKGPSRRVSVDERSGLGSEGQSAVTKSLQDGHTSQSQMEGEADQPTVTAEELAVLVPEEEQSAQLVKDEDELVQVEFAPEEDDQLVQQEASVTGSQGHEAISEGVMAKEEVSNKEEELRIVDEQEKEVTEEEEQGDMEMEEELEDEDLGDSEEELEGAEEEGEVAEEELMGTEEQEVKEDELLAAEDVWEMPEEKDLEDAEEDEDLQVTKKEVIEELEVRDVELDEEELRVTEEEEVSEEVELGDAEEDEDKEDKEELMVTKEEVIQVRDTEEEGKEEGEIRISAEVTEEEELGDTEEVEEELRTSEEEEEVTEEVELGDAEEDEDKEELMVTKEEVTQVRDTEGKEEGEIRISAEVTEEEELEDTEEEEVEEEELWGTEEEEQEVTEKEQLGDFEAWEEENTEESELENTEEHEEMLGGPVVPVNDEGQERGVPQARGEEGVQSALDGLEGHLGGGHRLDEQE